MTRGFGFFLFLIFAFVLHKTHKTFKMYANTILLLIALFCPVMITKCNASTGTRYSATTTTGNTDTAADVTSIHTFQWNPNMCLIDTNVPQFIKNDMSDSYCKNHRYTSTSSSTTSTTRTDGTHSYDGGLIMTMPIHDKYSKPTIEEPNYILVDDSKRHLIRSASKWFTLGFSMLKVFMALYDDRNGDLDYNDVDENVV